MCKRERLKVPAMGRVLGINVGSLKVEKIGGGLHRFGN